MDHTPQGIDKRFKRLEYALRCLRCNTSGGGGEGAVLSVNGETGIVTLDKSDIGLGNVDNTPDSGKPVSTAQAIAIATKQNQLNGNGFVKASGTTITYDSTTYQPLLTNPVTGTGVATRLAYWNGTNTLTSDADLTFDGTTLYLPSISTPTTMLTLKQTGDTFGESGLLLVNRAGSAGGMFYNNALDLVDMAFRSSTSNQFNFRYEHRTSELRDAANTGGEFQLLSATGTIINQSFGNASARLNKLTVDDLAGVGNRMVVAGSGGTLTTQAIPAGGTIDSTVIDGSTNAVSGNAVYDAIQALGVPGQLYVDDTTISGDGTSGSPLSVIYPSTLAAISTKTANYTLTNADNTILADASGGSFTLTLPTVTGNSGRTFIIKRIDINTAFTVTVDANGSELIDGDLTAVISATPPFWPSITIRTNGTAWYII